MSGGYIRDEDINTILAAVDDEGRALRFIQEENIKNPNIPYNISEFKDDLLGAEFDATKFERAYEDTSRKGYRSKLREMEYKLQQAEQQNKDEQARRTQAELQRRRADDRRKKAEVNLIDQIRKDTDRLRYDHERRLRRELNWDLENRLLRWSMGIIPTDFPLTQREQLERSLRGVIRRELLLGRSREELERAILSIIQTTLPRPKSRRKAKSKTRKAKPKAKSKSRKAKAKAKSKTSKAKAKSKSKTRKAKAKSKSKTRKAKAKSKSKSGAKK